jgi:hypothetical protein
MKNVSLVAFVASVVAGCSGADQGRAGGSSAPRLGESTAAQSPGALEGTDAGKSDAGYLEQWWAPDGATGGTRLDEHWVTPDGSTGCPAPAALAQSATCAQAPLPGGAYYVNLDDPAEGMLDMAGDPISQPLDSCAADQYFLECTWQDAGGGYGVQSYPPASLGCSETPGAGDTPTFHYCCPCP